MTLKERVKALADERGISLPVLESELGFGNSTIVKWDKSIPNAEKLNSVAKYFNVSMDYLLNGTNQDGLLESDNKDIGKRLEEILLLLNNSQDNLTFFDRPLSFYTIEVLKISLENDIRSIRIITNKMIDIRSPLSTERPVLSKKLNNDTPDQQSAMSLKNRFKYKPFALSKEPRRISKQTNQESKPDI